MQSWVRQVYSSLWKQSIVIYSLHMCFVALSPFLGSNLFIKLMGKIPIFIKKHRAVENRTATVNEIVYCNLCSLHTKKHKRKPYSSLLCNSWLAVAHVHTLIIKWQYFKKLLWSIKLYPKSPLVSSLSPPPHSSSPSSMKERFIVLMYIPPTHFEWTVKKLV